MKIQIASDLHLEFHSKSIPTILIPSAPVLCLAGDICVCGDSTDFKKFVDFLKFYCNKFDAIVHIAGNHEYYTKNKASPKELSNNTIVHIDKRLKGLSKYFANYHYLHNSTWTYTIPKSKQKYVFIGSTLWTHIPKTEIVDKKNNRKVAIADLIERRMNDYNYIYMPTNSTSSTYQYRQYTVVDMQRKHKIAVNFLTRTIAKAKTIVAKAVHIHESPPVFILLTHHKPVFDGSTDKGDIYTYAYESDLASQLLVSPIVLAAHGHTHKHYDKKINGVRVVSNPKGYVGEHTGYNNQFVVNV
jgi:predicted phosphodiesterase